MAYIKLGDALKLLDRNSITKKITLVDGVSIYDSIKSLPTADVEEVKHGEWIKTDRGICINANTGQSMRVYACDCSCCGWHTGHQGTEFKYCPECGAIMDGGNEE